MDRKTLEAAVAAFPKWHYEFDLDGVKTPVERPEKINRHDQRYHHMFTPLLELAGGSLKGKRILDLGCNAGFWCLKAIEHGAQEVCGIDGRRMHIDQANLVFSNKKIDQKRYEFIQADVYELDFTTLGEFDVVFFLGLMYHIAKPVELFEKISIVGTDILLIDTLTVPGEGAFFDVKEENIAKPLNALQMSLILRPSRGAVHRLAKFFGYQTITLEPRFDDYTGCEVYRKGSRRAFLGAKRSPIKIVSKFAESLP